VIIFWSRFLMSERWGDWNGVDIKGAECFDCLWKISGLKLSLKYIPNCHRSISIEYIAGKILAKEVTKIVQDVADSSDRWGPIDGYPCGLRLRAAFPMHISMALLSSNNKHQSILYWYKLLVPGDGAALGLIVINKIFPPEITNLSVGRVDFLLSISYASKMLNCIFHFTCFFGTVVHLLNQVFLFVKLKIGE